MTRRLTMACAVLLVVFGLSSAQAQQIYPAFTLVVQINDYDEKGEVLSSGGWTQYHSATGDWRAVRSSGGYEMATLYRRGDGVYMSAARTGVLLKQSEHAPGCPLRTAEQLRSDPKFTRTEIVLGFEAFVITKRMAKVGYVMETFFIPELGGGTPVKRIYAFDNGRRMVEEPISITLGEPAAADISGPLYRLIEQMPCWSKGLAGLTISKPEPVYPPEARVRRIVGTIYVSVVVDESGRVLSANSITTIPFLTEAAVEAAYLAEFSPAVATGRPALVRGTISYQFTLPTGPGRDVAISQVLGL